MYIFRADSSERHQRRNVVKVFLQKYGEDVTGVLCGFGRLVFRGTLRRLVYQEGMMGFVYAAQVLLKDFGRYVLSVSSRLKEASLELARQNSRPVEYLASSQISKEDVARKIAARDGITEGLVCVLTCVEPCRSFEIFRNRETKHLQLLPRLRKCLHLYHYYVHPVLGFMNARIQSWFPLSIQICLNGREWLARQMDKDGMSYERRDNCFTWIENPARAQELMDSQLRASWPTLLKDIAAFVNPAHDEIFMNFPIDYYWSVHQSEWASDIMFRSPDALAKIYPLLVRHAMTTFSSPDVMRFLGRKIDAGQNVHHAFTGQVVSDLKTRPEGVRIKHRVNNNSIKLYDKQGSVLRPETTINDPKDIKVYRPKEGDSSGQLDWRPLRKGVADLHRRAQVSQAANNRYLDALAAVADTTPLKSFTEALCQPIVWKGKRVRAINPYSLNDGKLLELVSRGEFIINGFRNRDIRNMLYPDCKNASPDENRRRSSATTRKIRILRAHGLVKKIPRSQRYLLTEKGRTFITVLIAAGNANANSLTKMAA